MMKNSYNRKCTRIHGNDSTFFFNIGKYYKIDFKGVITIQYLLYDNIGG